MEVERRLSRASFHCATLAQKCIDVLSRFPAAPKDMARLPLELEARVNIAAMTSNPFMKGDDLVAALDDLTTAAALEELDLSRHSNVKDAHLLNIAKRARNLRVLCIDECSHLTGKAFDSVGTTDDDESATFGVLEELRVLSCNSCAKLHDIERLAYGMGQLEEAHFFECKALQSGAIHALASQCLELRSLDLTGCADAVRDDEVQMILTSLPKLRVLLIGNCYRLTDAGIARAVSSASSSPSHAPLFTNIETLDISGCCHLTDNAVRSLGASAVQLRHLNLSFLDAVTDEAVADLFDGRCGSTIESLVLDQCDSLTDDFLFALAKNERVCCSLKELSVSFLNISDEAVFALMRAAAVGGSSHGSSTKSKPRALGSERHVINFHGLADCPGITLAVTRKLLSYLEQECGAGRGVASCLPVA